MDQGFGYGPLVEFGGGGCYGRHGREVRRGRESFAGFGDQLFHDDGQNVGSTYGTTGFEYVEGNLVPPPTHKHTASTGSTLKMKL